uniref:Serine aminopeptidase S33 domain-containing protein n=1 Tax=Leersia perrieri TaxID=77586 RepID=A0A0D9V0V1_9ORYZ
MRLVGLTGGIASGKSTVSNLFKASGIPVVDADIVARNVVQKGTGGWKKIVEAFGNDVLLENGEIDWARLGQIVFSDPEKRQSSGPAYFIWDILGDNKTMDKRLQVINNSGTKDETEEQFQQVLRKVSEPLTWKERLRSRDEAAAVDRRGSRRRRRAKKVDEVGLDPLYDDGFGEVTVTDYLEAVRAMFPLGAGAGAGPPRWFCPVDCGRPAIDGAPPLLFLPGIDGVGMELIMHHKSLAKVFEVRCLHIPVSDRTPYEGLLQILEEYVKYEHSLSPNRPIYITGDSFGGCLALSLAARNPEIDLAILPLLEMVPSNLPVTLPHLLRYLIGDPLKMAMVSTHNNSFPRDTLQNFMPAIYQEFGNVIQMDTLVWKLKLIKSGADYTNSHLDAVQAEVLLLASGNDNLPPSGEADRLFKALKSCKVRYFRTSSDRLLMVQTCNNFLTIASMLPLDRTLPQEDSFNLLTVIKGASMYRQGKQRDAVADFLPPTLSEFKRTFDEDFKLVHRLLSPVMLSTLRNGKIVRGLAGVPDKGPVLLVGYHQLLAMEVTSMVEEFLREKKAVLRALAHPVFFVGNYETLRQELSLFDVAPMYGGVQVNPISTYRLFERDEFVLLYPGGIREALHRKGEDYQLFWPDQPEFVRMAAQFGVTIIPFGCVGEDDMLEILLDYNDIKNVPYIRETIESFNQDCPGVRSTVKGEEGNQVLHLPVVVPKVPGRLYYLFGKPIEMKGNDNIHRDRESANQLYLDIKSEVENIMSYLKRKREQDPYRSITARILITQLVIFPIFSHEKNLQQPNSPAAQRPSRGCHPRLAVCGDACVSARSASRHCQVGHTPAVYSRARKLLRLAVVVLAGSPLGRASAVLAPRRFGRRAGYSATDVSRRCHLVLSPVHQQ